MEVIGRICSNSKPQVHQDLKDCIEIFKIIKNVFLSVGLSKNNIFLEFDNNSGRIFRAYKTCEICKDFKVVHDLDGRYKIVLIFQNGFFEVIKPRYDEKNLFESVYKSKQSTVALDIIDDITGHQVLRVQYSPTTHEMLDFVEKRTQFQVQL